MNELCPVLWIKPQKVPTIPRDTTRVIRAILPKGNAITRLRDEFGTIYTDQDFLKGR
jgi:hypothetical protein